MSLIVFLFSLLAAWYEGSELLIRSEEWGYTAIFTQLLTGGRIEDASEILVIDHFVYALKFRPLFPILLYLSGLYFVSLLVYLLSKSNKAFCYYLFGAAAINLALSLLFIGSSTDGIRIFLNVMWLVTLTGFLLAAYLLRKTGVIVKGCDNP